MIRGLSQSDQPIESITMYDRMRDQGFSGNNLTFIFVLKACTRVSDVVCGHKIHVCSMKLGFESYIYVFNALIHMYASCGDLGFARKMFDEMGDRDLVSWKMFHALSLCTFSTDDAGTFQRMMPDDFAVGDFDPGVVDNWGSDFLFLFFFPFFFMHLNILDDPLVRAKWINTKKALTEEAVVMKQLDFGLFICLIL
ncbi:Pentatricopeptide repeat-containing protein [Camellia lanceoleosa]|uniref:Pentatricopeptide repeat-containing protein n=1 Tax=Camellia lanceoleosa TaxID=1840588 RepID=A0ACC0FX80_9ERIC|nr:Pentatricopeptide repeat-containing protein [Camellia lanceoleosa]